MKIINLRHENYETHTTYVNIKRENGSSNESFILGYFRQEIVTVTET